MKLRILKQLLLYLTATLLLLLLTVGLMNTFLGVASPVRPALDRVVSSLSFVPTISDRVKHGAQIQHPEKERTQTTQNSLVSAGRDGWHHSIDDTNALCAAPDVSTVPVWSERVAYTWIDENGVRSFGDEAPSTVSAHKLSVDEGDRDFELRVTWEGVKPNRALEGSLRAGAKRIYDQWVQWLGYKSLIRSRVSLRVQGNRTRFLRDWGGDVSGPTPSGFYSMARNEAIVLYRPGEMNEDRLLEVAFHEVAHLISTWQVGALPPWYAEGLAEYFETMKVQSQFAEFRARREWGERAERNGVMPLQQLLALNSEQWFTGDIHRRYSTAGALIAFMMTTDRGREELKALAHRAQKARCSPRSARKHLAPSGYPGGVRRLEAEFRRWLL